MRVSVPCGKLIRRARKIAKHLGSATLLPEHFMLVLAKTRNAATRFLVRAGIALKEMRTAVLGEILKEPRSTLNAEPFQSDRWNIVMTRAATLAKNGKRNSIGTFDVLAAFAETDGVIEWIFDVCKAAFAAIRQFIESLVTRERRYADPLAIA